MSISAEPLRISFVAAKLGGEQRAADRQEKAGWPRRGVAWSAALHALIALLIVVGLPRPAPPPAEMVVPIDLVQLGGKTASPPRQQVAALPQEAAPEQSKQQPADPIPVPQLPPPTPRAKNPESDPLAALSLRNGFRLPKPQPKPQTGHSLHPLAAPKPLKKPAPPLDDIETRLKSLAKLRQPPAPLPASPRQQNGQGLSNINASSANAAPGLQAAYGVKDFIRAQIERHWYFDRSTPGAADMIVSIHLQLTADGRVSGAAIVDEGGYSTNEAYRAVAISLRDAVLLSQPLTLPAGRYGEVKDVILDFSPRDVLQ